MAHASPLRGALIALLMISGGCGGSDPFDRIVAPTAPSPPAPLTPRPGQGFPVVSRPARIYMFDRAATSPVRSWTLASRFVLYDDGAFALQYGCCPFFTEYRGTYEEASSRITFRWEGSSVADPWAATGSLTGESLTVTYNDMMLHTDFEDAVYSRLQ